MHAKEFERRLAVLLGVPHSELEHRGRKLREHDLLPKGGHGPHAPHIGPEHASFYILSCVSRRATAGGEVAVRAAALKPATNVREDPLWLFLTKLLSDPCLSRGERLVIDEDGAFALFAFKDDDGVERELPFVHRQPGADNVEVMAGFLAARRSSISRQLTIGSGALDETARWVADRGESRRPLGAGAGSIEQIERVVEGAIN